MASTYVVELRAAPANHTIPPLLAALGDFVATKKHGVLGWFDAISAEEIPSTWNESASDRLRRDGFTFLNLPDGSLLALIDTGSKGARRAVVLLGSEGEARTVADSLEEFLVLWSKGETDINELDDEEAEEGRAELRAWLKSHKVKAPKTP